MLNTVSCILQVRYLSATLIFISSYILYRLVSLSMNKFLKTEQSTIIYIIFLIVSLSFSLVILKCSMNALNKIYIKFNDVIRGKRKLHKEHPFMDLCFDHKRISYTWVSLSIYMYYVCVYLLSLLARGNPGI